MVKPMRAYLPAILLSLPLLASCRALPGPIACTALYAYGVSATVKDVDTGAAIESAALTLTDGSYQEIMQAFPGGGYVGAGERAGTYTLRAIAAGYQSKSISDIVVTADECHVQGVHVDVSLEPSP
jgi:hypothetical protein